MRIRLILATAVGTAVARRAMGPTLVPWPQAVDRGFAPVVGGIAGASVLSLTSARVARSVLATSVVTGVLLRAARPRVLRSLAAKGRDLDEAFAQPPATPSVSGSSESLVDLTELGREGARFVSTVSSREDIAEVLGVDREDVLAPIRVCVGMDAGTPEQRVSLAMAELRRTRAFDRAYLVIAAPAGSGYVNPTPVQVVEALTAGDCATVAIGYGLLPSFLSLSRVTQAQRVYDMLLRDIAAECADRIDRGERIPRIFAYGESLGARVLHGVLVREPELASLVDRALWVGLPGGATDADGRFDHVVIDSRDDVAHVTSLDAQWWFLQHDADPVVRFRRELLWKSPEWLDAPRGRNVPEGMRWQWGITWAQVLVDTMFATKVRPGDFDSFGHDYRADLGTVVAAAYGLSPRDEVAERLEAWLRSSERARAAALHELVVH